MDPIYSPEGDITCPSCTKTPSRDKSSQGEEGGFFTKELLGSIATGLPYRATKDNKEISFPHPVEILGYLFDISHPLHTKHSFSWISCPRSSGSRSCFASHVIFCLREIAKALSLHASSDTTPVAHGDKLHVERDPPARRQS